MSLRDFAAELGALRERALFRDECAARAVYRSLLPAERSVVARSLTVEFLKASEIAPKVLKSLCVMGALEETDASAVALNAALKSSLQDAFTKSPEIPFQTYGESTNKRKLAPDKTRPTLELVDETCHARWNAVMEDLVADDVDPDAIDLSEIEEERATQRLGSNLIVAPISVRGKVKRARHVEPEAISRVRRALKSMNLSNDENVVTSAGYEFLLRDAPSQVWGVLRHWATTNENEESVCAVLSTLFKISTCSPGLMCAVQSLSETERTQLSFLEALGVVYRRSATSKRFYPSSLGVASVFGTSKDIRANLKIVLETNFKIYAYSTTRLHVGMLSLFSRVETVLPNLIIAHVTRKTCQRAYDRGISSEQLLRFLKRNVDPNINKLPPNVTDQMTLWEAERNRISSTPGALFAFQLSESGKRVFDQVKATNKHVWCDDENQRLFVESKAYEETAALVKRIKKG